MFDDWKEAFLSFITSRIFVLMVLFCGFFGILMSRVFVLQIIDGKQYAGKFYHEDTERSEHCQYQRPDF